MLALITHAQVIFIIQEPQFNSKIDLEQSYHLFAFGRTDQVMSVKLGNEAYLMHI